MVLERILKGSSTGYGDVCSSANKRDINVIRLNKCQHLEDINVIQTGNGPTRLSKYIYIYISVLSGRKQHVRLKAESQKTPRLASKLAISARLSLKQPALDVSLMASGLDPFVPIVLIVRQYGGFFPWVGASYRLQVHHGAKPLQWLPGTPSCGGVFGCSIRNSKLHRGIGSRRGSCGAVERALFGPSFHLSHDHCSACFSYCCGQCDVDRRGRITTAPNQFTWHLLGDPGLRLSCPSTSILQHQLLQA